MKIKFYKALSVATVIIIYFFITSCHEKGCTDPAALNYNSVADQDDGSCVTCKVISQDTAYITQAVYDYNSQSIHYSEHVADFNLIRISQTYNYTDCGETSCSLSLNIRSYVSQQMTISYTLQSSFITYQNVSTIPGYQEMYAGPISSTSAPCSSIGSFSIYQNNNISYQ